MNKEFCHCLFSPQVMKEILNNFFNIPRELENVAKFPSLVSRIQPHCSADLAIAPDLLLQARDAGLGQRLPQLPAEEDRGDV